MSPLPLRRRRVLQAAALGLAGAVAGCLDIQKAGSSGGRESRLRVENVAEEAGFIYEYSSPEYPGQKDILTNAGVYISDVTRNGQPDVLALGGSEPILFENEGGSFEPRVPFDGVDADIDYTGALFLDADSDGWDELLLFARQGPPVFLDNVDGEFEVVSVGFEDHKWPRTGVPLGAAAADYDGDGHLDLFVIQNGNWTVSQPIQPFQGEFFDPDADNGAPNYLFAGDGESFELVEDAGIEGERWSLATSFFDLTGNGHPDIHVANDFNYDVLYENQGDGTFEKRDIPNSNRHGMSSTVADITGDGSPDLFVTNIYYPPAYAENVPFVQVNMEGNNLFTFEDGEIVDRAEEYSLRKGGWGWASIAEDLTNDGTKEVLHTTMPLGSLRELAREMDHSEADIREKFSYLLYPSLYEGTEDGGYAQIPAHQAGFELTDARGLAVCDIDGDGALDLFFANSREEGEERRWRGTYRLYENQTDIGAWLQVDIVPDGAPVEGTRVTVVADGLSETQVYHSRTDFLSQSWRTLHFGLGEAEESNLVIEWSDGTEHSHSDVPANQRIQIYPDGSLTPL